ncbi:MAG: cytochrome c biogenesis protein CcsA [Candidatus Rokubacteria bacterium]|nr:cytochrome c biogenesis protein CcsA [Candidatus Rokubacteria bacterium]
MGRPLGVVTLLALAVGLGAAFGWAPRDAVQGNVQRIMYLHVPAILTAYAAIGVAFVASLAYLRGRDPRWDRLAHASVEVGVLFTAITLVSGSLWGRPTWGTWWTWDARITTTALLFIIYLGYLLLRSVVEDPERAATYAAVVAIVGALDIPIIHFSVEWWRTLHQPATLLRPQAPTMAAPMVATLLLNLAATLCLYAFLVRRRMRLAVLEAEARARRWR